MNDPKLVSRLCPTIACAFFLWCYAGQVIHMWTKHTAAGQSLFGWIGLAIALCSIHHFYCVCTPKERIAIWSVRAEIMLNIVIIVQVLCLR